MDLLAALLRYEPARTSCEFLLMNCELINGRAARPALLAASRLGEGAVEAGRGEVVRQDLGADGRPRGVRRDAWQRGDVERVDGAATAPQRRSD